MLTRLLVSGLFAGAAAGLIAALLQLIFVQPVLLHAELYESGELVHFGTEAVSAQQELGGIDPLRDGLSVIFTMLTYTGYAFILLAGMAIAEMRGAVITGRNGLLWGVAGFVAFHFAPGFSLAPEVPGVAAADVFARQIWWWATVLTAGAGLWLIAFGRNWMAWGAAAMLLLAPHVIGAPEPDTFTGPVPTEIGAMFASRAFGVGMAAWLLLGCFAGFFWQREGARVGATQAA
ncbi:putative cobalt transporter subunit (CbtA) (plasmid) [Labrenzia sp. THAF191b]|uniref:Putative integral membrane protein n=1 Tax=Roseibium alexandrii (strain DSM 17067 / NCIMB 14079 / DFL-11) TaxID=244592 RepID=A0A5E8H7J1_ROSAD|nr:MULTISPECIES: CbtA family protein [Stappiaceae]EEE48165.1 putative integral membrane protein [Roseibium alexandrii DFL-11]QFT02049.1 putative cobalt transporter subunit (CbtA) [Labrenzia sp. THAF191b]QFT19887.1 putative cobalt transporter subunit (CbtA) [Labrenzia sp. THAF187b]QFT71291.1 putative cobalt transporter subunit (CbtA) [Labrenzia sp. THAF35]